MVKRARQRLGLDGPAIYQIKVQGQLDERWSAWFEGTTVTVEREVADAPITTLTVAVADQAALQGMLRALYTLGLPIRSVSCLASDGATPPNARQGTGN